MKSLIHLQWILNSWNMHYSLIIFIFMCFNMPVNIIVSLKEHLCRVHEHVNIAFQSNLHLGWGIRLWSHLSSWEIIRIKSVVQFHSCSWYVAFQQHQYKHFSQMPFIGVTGKLEKSLVNKQIKCQWILTSLRLQPADSRVVALWDLGRVTLKVPGGEFLPLTTKGVDVLEMAWS